MLHRLIFVILNGVWISPLFACDP